MARFKNKQGLGRSKQNSETAVKKKREVKLGWAKNYLLALLRIVLAVVAVLVAKYATEYIIEMNNFYATWWLQFAITTILAIVILLTLGAAFPSNENTKMTKKVVFGLMIIFLLGWYLLPFINERNFDQSDQPIKWLNIKTREIYHKPLNPVKDVKGKKFFLHPASLDTCVLLTERIMKSKPKKSTPNYMVVDDTIFSKVYVRQGKFNIDVYGGDVLDGDKLIIENINKKGVSQYITTGITYSATPMNSVAVHYMYRPPSSQYKNKLLCENYEGAHARISVVRRKVLEK